MPRRSEEVITSKGLRAREVTRGRGRDRVGSVRAGEEEGADEVEEEEVGEEEEAVDEEEDNVPRAKVRASASMAVAMAADKGGLVCSRGCAPRLTETAPATPVTVTITTSAEVREDKGEDEGGRGPITITTITTRDAPVGGGATREERVGVRCGGVTTTITITTTDRRGGGSSVEPAPASAGLEEARMARTATIGNG
jgi:hypothetical protein